MGIAYYTNDYLAPSDSLLSITYNAANQDSRLIRGYDYINQISWYCERGGNSNQSIFLDDQLFLSASLYSDGMLHIKDSNNKELDVFNLNSLQKNLLEFDHTHSYVEAVPVNKMTYEMSGKNVRIKLYVESLDLNRENVNTSYYISQIRASLLIKLSTI